MKKYILLSFLILLFPLATQAIEVNLTWSTDTYTPSFYKGRALPTRNSNIEVAANLVPETNIQNLTFNWYLDDLFEENGKAKQIFSFKSGLRTNLHHFVRVEIADNEGNIIAESSNLPIRIVEPEIVVSPTKNNLDIFEQISDSLDIKYQVAADQELKFVAHPYFFGIEELDELKYAWQFAGRKAPQLNPKNPNILSLKIGKVSRDIIQSLYLSTENRNNPLQRAQYNTELKLIP